LIPGLPTSVFKYAEEKKTNYWPKGRWFAPSRCTNVRDVDVRCGRVENLVVVCK
jgi:hypothetical protein